MINFPYVPQPYPDEILGSWLARIALLNGRGAWRTLLEESGFGRRIEKPLFDMPDFDTKTNNLLNHLGCTYEYALLNLSTFQYWASFECSNTEYLKGTAEVKALIQKGKVVSQLNRVGHQSSQSISLKPYFCSLCLISDLSNFGEPYWRRSHQLPTVYYCPTHHIPLQNKCTGCSISNLTGGKNLMPLPSMVCSCGYDYRKQENSLVFSSEIYQRLTKVSIDALQNQKQNWCADNVKAYFKNLTLEYLGAKKGQIYQKIKKIFGAEEISPSRFLIKPPGHIGPELFFRPPSLFRSSEYCLILASMDIDFVSASESFSGSILLMPCPPMQNKVVGVPENVESAFTQLSERIKHCPNSPISRHATLYWYLRINAVDSLKCFLPNIHQQPIPTIEEDRSKIKILLSTQSKPKYNNSAPIVRATIRDNAWLDNQKQEKYQNSKNQIKVNKQQQDCLLFEKLKHKLQEILNNENRPERITLIRLGAHISYSASQIIQFAKKFPELNQEIKKINNDKMRRQLVWAAKELKSEGVILTAKKIHRKASLPFSPISSRIVHQLLINK